MAQKGLHQQGHYHIKYNDEFDYIKKSSVSASIGALCLIPNNAMLCGLYQNAKHMELLVEIALYLNGFLCSGDQCGLFDWLHDYI